MANCGSSPNRPINDFRISLEIDLSQIPFCSHWQAADAHSSRPPAPVQGEGKLLMVWLIAVESGLCAMSPSSSTWRGRAAASSFRGQLALRVDRSGMRPRPRTRKGGATPVTSPSTRRSELTTGKATRQISMARRHSITWSTCARPTVRRTKAARPLTESCCRTGQRADLMGALETYIH